jgi:cobalt-zinc-cadmium efflux system outer membrane protein
MAARIAYRPRTRLTIALLTSVALSTLALQAQAPASLTLNESMVRAAESNRTVLAARTARNIGTAELMAAGQRPNPEVSVEAERETPHWSFGAGVPIEIGGKRQARIGVAQAALATNDAELERVIEDVRSDVRRAYYQAVAASRNVEIAEELQQIAVRARDAADLRFKTGAAPRLEALQAELILAEAQNDVIARRGTVTAARAELNALLAFPLDASPTLADALNSGTVPSAAGASALALERNAELRVLARQIEEQRARLALAKAMRRPDPVVSGTLTYDAQPEFTFGWRAGVAVALPLFTTGRFEIAIADATLNRAIAERDSRAAQVTGAVTAAVARAAAARQTLDRYESEILPASRQVEQMAQESYASGQSGLAALLQTVQSAREIRQRALQAALDYQIALADLERAMGTPLT